MKAIFRENAAKMFASSRARKILISALCMTSLTLGFILIVLPTPDLSLEQELTRQIARLRARVELAEQVNIDRKDDLQQLFMQFSTLAKALLNKQEIKPMGFEAEAMVQGQNWTYDLSLPSIRYSLPHVVISLIY